MHQGTPKGWLSYDLVADAYEQVAVPWFGPMAADLVDALEIGPAQRVLDVGTGTGLVAGLARRRGSTVIGGDPSFVMLQAAQARRGTVGTQAMAPGLPFPDASFDVVVSNLVLSHFVDLDSGLADMVRVLRRGGRFGATAWGPRPLDTENQGIDADRILGEVGRDFGLAAQAPVKAAPWEESLRSRETLLERLTRARLVDLKVESHTYRHSFAITEYLSGWGGLCRYQRSQVGEDRWRRYCEKAADKLSLRFGDTIVYVGQFWLATGTAAA